jgi:hypothetical protein
MRNRAIFPEHTFYAVADMLQQSFRWDASHTVEHGWQPWKRRSGWPGSTRTRPYR